MLRRCLAKAPGRALPDPRRAGRGAWTAARPRPGRRGPGGPARGDAARRRDPGRPGRLRAPPGGPPRRPQPARGPDQLRGPGARGGRRCGSSCAAAGPRAGGAPGDADRARGAGQDPPGAARRRRGRGGLPGRGAAGGAGPAGRPGARAPAPWPRPLGVREAPGQAAPGRPLAAGAAAAAPAAGAGQLRAPRWTPAPGWPTPCCGPAPAARPGHQPGGAWGSPGRRAGRVPAARGARPGASAAAWRGWRRARRCASSSSAPRPSRPGFALTAGNAAGRGRGLPAPGRAAPGPRAGRGAGARAAAWSRSPARLDDRFRLLTAGSRDGPARTSRPCGRRWTGATTCSPRRSAASSAAWPSSPGAGRWRRRRRSAPRGAAGRRPEGGLPEDVLDLLGGLVDKSLVVAGEVEPGGRASAGGAALPAAGDGARVRPGAAGGARGGGAPPGRATRPTTWPWRSTAEPALNGPEQAAWLARLEREHDNLRAALRWAIGEGHEGGQGAQAGQAETALRLGGALAKFWTVRGYQSEGQRWLDAALARASGATPARRARACYAAGRMARARRDYGAARSRYEECLSLWREVGDRRGVALALASLGGVAGDQGLAETARALHEESLALRRASADRRGVAQSLNYLGMLAFARGDYRTAACAAGGEPGPEPRAAGRRGRRLGPADAGADGRPAGRPPTRATAPVLESLDLFREVGNLLGVAMAQRPPGRPCSTPGPGGPGGGDAPGQPGQRPGAARPLGRAASLVSPGQRRPATGATWNGRRPSPGKDWPWPAPGHPAPAGPRPGDPRRDGSRRRAGAAPPASSAPPGPCANRSGCPARRRSERGTKPTWPPPASP